MSERLQKIWQHIVVNKPYLKKTLLRALAFISLLTAGVNLLAWKLLYLPQIDGQYSDQNQLYFRLPSERGLDYNDIEIVKNGVTLKGWFIKQPNFQSAPTVVFFHENAGNIGWRLEYLSKYYQIVKCNIVIVAYRGYDHSTGSPSQQGIQNDAIAIAEHTFENLGIDKSNVYAHGRSLGGAVATWAVFSQLQKKDQFKGLILENTFTSINEVVANMNFVFKLVSPLLFFNTWKTIDRIGKINKPIHFISSGRDELIPYPLMRKLIEHATGTKQNTHHHIPQGDHNSNWLVDQADYFNSINRFMQQI